MALSLVSGPASEPLTTAEAKTHLRVSTSDDDTYIGTLIKVARRAAEHKTGRALLPQTWLMTVDDFPRERSRAFRLRRCPVTAVSWVKYYDTTGTLTTLSTDAYVVDMKTEPGRIAEAYSYCWPQVYPRIAGVTVQYVAGYADAAAVPEGIKQWMLLRIGALYENREEVQSEKGLTVAVEMPFMDSLLDDSCVPGVG